MCITQGTATFLIYSLYLFKIPCKLQVGPKIVDFNFGSESLLSGTSAQVQCFVSEGDTPLQITWAFHGTDMTTRTQSGVSTMKLGQKSSVLMIDSVTSEHAGNYTCTARNAAASANYTAELIVNGLWSLKSIEDSSLYLFAHCSIDFYG